MIMHAKALTHCSIFSTHQLIMTMLIGGLRQIHGVLLAFVVPVAQ